MKVFLIYSAAPRQTREWLLDLAPGSTLAQAIDGCSLLAEFPELDSQVLKLGVWGRKASAGQILREHDRIEIYRSLRVDPKVARRERFNRQGVKRTGLFAKTREGGKAGY